MIKVFGNTGNLTTAYKVCFHIYEGGNMEDKLLQAYQRQCEKRGIIQRDCPICHKPCYNFNQLAGHLMDHGLSLQEAKDMASKIITGGQN